MDLSNSGRSAALACGAVTPGFNRPTHISRMATRLVACSASSIAAGASTSACASVGISNSLGSTPTMVTACPSSGMVLPTTA